MQDRHDLHTFIAMPCLFTAYTNTLSELHSQVLIMMKAQGQLNNMHHVAPTSHTHMQHSESSNLALQGLFLRETNAVILAVVVIFPACLCSPQASTSLQI